MKPLTKAIRSAHAEGKPWTKHMYKFLLNYRTTPHSTTGFAPSELLFNRKVGNKLPQFASVAMTTNIPHNTEKVKENDSRGKWKMKVYADEQGKAKVSDIRIGDVVLARQRKHNKLSTRFDPLPFCVVRIKGTMIIASRNGKYFTRNVSQFKIVDPSLQREKSTEEEEDNEDFILNPEATVNPGSAVRSGAISSLQNTLRRSSRDRRKVHRFGQNIYEQ